jgi:hypothetical protein
MRGEMERHVFHVTSTKCINSVWAEIRVNGNLSEGVFNVSSIERKKSYSLALQ